MSYLRIWRFWFGGVVPWCFLVLGVAAHLVYLPQFHVTHGWCENSDLTVAAGCCPVCYLNLLTPSSKSFHVREVFSWNLEKGVCVVCILHTSSLPCKVISCKLFLPVCNKRHVTIKEAQPHAFLKLSQSPAPCYSCVQQKQNRLWCMKNWGCGKKAKLVSLCVSK